MSNQLYPSNVKGLTWTVLRTPEFRTITQESAAFYQVRIAQTRNPIWHYQLIYEWLYGNYPSPNNTVPNNPASDIDTLMGFFMARQGMLDDFLFLDPQYNTPNGIRFGTWQATTAYALDAVIIDTNGHAQVVTSPGTSGTHYPAFSTSGSGTVDGTVSWLDKGYFPTGWPDAPVTLPVVTDGNGNYFTPIQRNVGNLFMEDITDLVPSTLQVYSAGTLTTAYSLLGPGFAVPGASYAGMYLKWAFNPTQPITATFQFYFRLRFEEDTQDFEQWAQTLFTIGGEKGKSGSGQLKMMTSRPVPAF